MTITHHTTLRELNENSIISNRIYNRFASLGLQTVGDVKEKYESPTAFLTVSGFGSKAYCEIQSLYELLATGMAIGTVNDTADDTQESSMPQWYNRLSPSLCHYMEKVYQNMCASAGLGVRVSRLQRETLPTFKDAARYFDRPLKEYEELCPGQNLRKTLKELYLFIEKLNIKVQEALNFSDEEAERESVRLDFPYLSSKQCQTVAEYQRETDALPMFYLLYHFVRLSESRSEKAFCLRFGLFDGKCRSRNEVAELLGITHERVRQLTEANTILTNDFLLQGKVWKNYSPLFALPYITKDSPFYLSIKEKEHLPFDFQVFARLTSLVADFFVVEYNGMTFALHNTFIDKSNFKKLIDNIEDIVSSKHSSVSLILISEFTKGVACADLQELEGLALLMATTIYHLTLTEDGKLQVRQNYIDVEKEIFAILQKSGKPMGIEDIFRTFKETYPEHKYTSPSQLRPYIQKAKHVRALGKQSLYALDTWEDVCFGSIRDLIIALLEKSPIPLPLSKICTAIQKHYPNTNARSIGATMRSDEKDRFVRFKDNLYGLASKDYDYEVAIISPRTRKGFQQYMEDVKAFVTTYQRYPFSDGGEQESNLYRWLYRAHKGIFPLSDDQASQLEAMEKDFEALHVPHSLDEQKMKEWCREYKEYVAYHHSLPSWQKAQELHRWMQRAKLSYDSYTDQRRHYLTDLFLYLESLGFCV